MPVATPAPALGVNARLAIGPAAPTTLPLDFSGETLGLREVFLDPQGLRGTRAHAAARVRPSARLVTGDVTLGAPTATELGYILPYVTGGSATPSGGGNTFPAAETLSAFFLDLLRGATLFRYTGCRVSRAEFSATAGGPLRVNLSVLGVDETKPGGAFPSLTLANDSFFIWPDSVGAVVIDGTMIDCFSWRLVWDNVVQVRSVNSQTATVVYSTDRIITQEFRVPWGDAETLYGLAQGGVATSVTLTNGTTSFSASSANFQAPRQSPDVAGRDEIVNVISGMCRYSSGGLGTECTLFLDAT
jgi:hypothetical protein